MRFSGSLLLAAALCSTMAAAQSSSSSREAQQDKQGQGQSPASGSAATRTPRAEAAGAAITLETSEPLFDLATGMNACGYDDDLAHSSPVRAEVRAEVDAATATDPAAAKAREALCQYMREHELNDRARQTAQYVSLSLYLQPPPGLLTTADETEMPPDALQVVNVLPLLRTFVDAAQLHAIWLKHRPEYEAITDRVHDPLTRAILDTNIYLRVPVSSYDGRRFQVLVEPMLAPSAPNARIYASDYDIVTSPNAAGNIRMDQVRHLYIDYVIEPLIYARAGSMERLSVVLKSVQNAPLEYVYKTDIIALLTECLIKAVEARTMDVGIAHPVKAASKQRVDLANYDAEMSVYDRQAEAVRQAQVQLDMRQGWVLTAYFYEQIARREHDSTGLKEDMGEMVYGMDADREQHQAAQINFLPVGSGDSIRHVAQAPTGMMLAEEKMLKGDLDGAMLIATKAMEDPKQDHAEAEYVIARVDLMQGDPESSMTGFETVLKSSRNPSTLAWAHVYRGRLFDTKDPPERAAAMAEYKAAAGVAGAPAEARAAAQHGLAAPFTIPKTTHTEEEPLDPTGKAEKDAYRPDEEQTPAVKTGVAPK